MTTFHGGGLCNYKGGGCCADRCAARAGRTQRSYLFATAQRRGGAARRLAGFCARALAPRWHCLARAAAAKRNTFYWKPFRATSRSAFGAALPPLQHRMLSAAAACRNTLPLREERSTLAYSGDIGRQASSLTSRVCVPRCSSPTSPTSAPPFGSGFGMILCACAGLWSAVGRGGGQRLSAV